MTIPWSTELPNDETQIDSTTELISLQDGNSNKRIRVSVPSLGQSVIPIHSISDLPSIINGFRTLKQDFVYLFVKDIELSEPLLTPAGWKGSILGVDNKIIEINRTGSGTCIQTLDIEGTISSIANAGNGSISITTSSPHGLLDGQFVNITGTTSYNQQHLIISNVTEFTFDVQIGFVGDESGAFDTGYNTINIANIGFTNNDTAEWLDVTAADTSSIFRYYNIRATGFENTGIVRKGIVRGYDGDFDFTNEGFILDDVDDGILSATTTTMTTTTTGRQALMITGALTRNINIDLVKFNLLEASQDPIRIESTVTNANISITNSPDNNVATDYFDTGFGGLDQTDPQVFTFNNGIRANSKNIASVKVVGNTTSFMPTVSFDSFDFGTSAIAGAEIELWELLDSQTGRFRYIGKNPFSGVLNMQIGIDASSGRDYTITLEKNASTIPEEVGPVTISDMTSLTLVAEITATTNNEFEPQIKVDVFGDSIIAPNMSLIITET